MAGIVRPSKIIIYKKFANIVICNRNQTVKTHAIIDLSDVNIVKHYRWHTTKKHYPRTTIDGKIIYLHRFLLNVYNDDIIDHINKNPLDNRRNNLRIADLSLNRINSKTNSNNTSGFRGVLYRKDSKKWEANIRINGKKIYLAETKDKKLAIAKRLEAERIFYNSKKVNT